MNVTLDMDDTNFLSDDYDTYSVKDLRKICDYYGIEKISKYKKMELINLILSNPLYPFR